VSRLKQRKTISIVCPHAGYIYSGPVAAHSYYNLALENRPKSVVIIGPNHTGMGSPIAMMNRGAWKTPLGEIKIDAEMADEIFRSSDLIDIDERAHFNEHSIEVQLPFLQHTFSSDLKFVPICMGFQDIESSREVGKAVAMAVSKTDAVIIASTDLTHHESQTTAKRNDGIVIDCILSMDEEELQKKVKSYGITMCGYGPVSATIFASKILGARQAKLLAYSTSGDVTGDYSMVVGYAAAKFSR
jgi:AmmeMemoRadiSam system protein B